MTVNRHSGQAKFDYRKKPSNKIPKPHKQARNYIRMGYCSLSEYKRARRLERDMERGWRVSAASLWIQ